MVLLLVLGFPRHALRVGWHNQRTEHTAEESPDVAEQVVAEDRRQQGNGEQREVQG